MFTLVTGGAGYIGGNLINILRSFDTEIVVVDNLKTGDIKRIPQGVEMEKVDITNSAELKRVFAKYSVNKVVHLAALKSIPEGEKFPAIYKEVNVKGTANLLDLCNTAKIEKFIFISSAAVYGNANSVNGTYSEAISPSPVSIYGKSKFEAEKILSNFQWKIPTWTTSLRLFNVVGELNDSLKDGQMTNLIPIVKSAIFHDKIIKVYGNDYETKDGTGIRDYVHVSDIVNIISQLLTKSEFPPEVMNIGSGVGHSVLEVIAEVENKLNKSSTVLFSPRRKGDLAKVIANNDLVKAYLKYEIPSDLRILI